MHCAPPNTIIFGKFITRHSRPRLDHVGQMPSVVNLRFIHPHVSVQSLSFLGCTWYVPHMKNYCSDIDRSGKSSIVYPVSWDPFALCQIHHGINHILMNASEKVMASSWSMTKNDAVPYSLVVAVQGHCPAGNNGSPRNSLPSKLVNPVG